MKQYIGLSVALSRTFTITKDVASGTQNFSYYATDTTPIYTVPAGRTARVMYIVLGGSRTGGTSTNTTTGTNQWLVLSTSSSVTLPSTVDLAVQKLYLSAGQSLYLRGSYVFMPDANDPIGRTAVVTLTVYLSIIEEY